MSLNRLAGEEANLDELCELGRAALDVDAKEIDTFLDALGVYLEGVDSWRAEVEARPGEGEMPESVRARFENLNVLHQQLLARADASKAFVASEMGEMHKKAGALRIYIDRFPQRITIAGRRKG